MLESLMNDPDSGTDLKMPGANVLMQKAAMYGHTKVIDWLHNGGMGVNSVPRTENGTETERPLLIATSSGHLPAVKLLLLLRGEVNHLNEEGMTPVHLAVMQGNVPKVLTTLLEQGGNLQTTAEKESGRQHLHVASAIGHAKSAKALLDSGVDVMALDKGGFPPHFLAAEHGRLAVLKLLGERRANLDYSLKDPDGSGRQASALSIAAGSGHISAVKYLLQEKDLSVETLRELAKRFGEGRDPKWQARLEKALELDEREKTAKTMEKVMNDPEKRADLEKFQEQYQKMTPEERRTWDRQMLDKTEHDEAKRKYEQAQQAKRVSRRAAEL